MDSQLAETDYLKFLNDEEKKALPQPSLEKISNEFRSKCQEISELQKEVEILKTNADQQKFQEEKEGVELRKLLENEVQLKTEAQNQLKILQEKVASLNDNLQNSINKINSLTLELEQMKTEQESASSRCVSMSSSIESKTKLNIELKEQISSLEEQLALAQRSKCEALIQAEEAAASQLQIQFKERRHEQEKNLLSRQVELLQQQLEERAEEVLTLRRDQSSSILALQSDLNSALEETRLLRDEREAHTKEIGEKTKRIEELLKSLNETRESESRLEASYRKELSAQEKLSNIYKRASEDQQKRCEELEKGVEELRQLLQEASEQYGALEKAKAKAEEEAQTSLDQRDLLIKDLKEELHKVNELLKSSARKNDDCLAELSPAAAAASQLMSKGLTLSQLYSEYINTSDKLFQVEEENKRISRYMEQVLKEIEERAPLFRRQREDYEKALETINTLHTQIDESISELEKQQSEAEEAQRRANFLGRENDRLNQQVKDLSKQVTVLLTQVEAARAGLPPPPLSVLEDVQEGTSASDVIGQHLVAFRDVSELQEQNAKLLASLRDLTDKLESSEKSAVEAKTQELNEEVEASRKEMAELRAGRERMQMAVENITRQRDMFRTLLNEKNVKVTPSKSNADVSSELHEKLVKDLEKAEKEIEKRKKEHEEYKVERNKNDQFDKNELEKLRSINEKTRNENIRLLSQAEYNEERLKTLQSNCEAYQRQVNALEEKSDTLQGIIGRHEGTIESLREHTLGLTKKVAQLEIMSANLKEEKALLKESEARLLAERDSLHRSQYSQSLLLSNLEAIKNSLDKSDSESRMRFENQVADLTQQCCRLKAKIESNIDLKEAQNKISALEGKLKKAHEDLSETRKSLGNAEMQANALKAQLNEIQHERQRGLATSPSVNRNKTGAISPQQPVTTRSTAISHTVRELQIQLTEERAKTNSLQTSLNQSQTNLNNLKKLVEEQEKQIKESSESNKAAQDEINSLRKASEEAAKTIKDLQEKLNAAVESEKALKEIMEGKLLAMTEDLEGRENELEETQKRLEDAKKAEEKSIEQLREQKKIALEMQSKYEREVMLHGADLQALSAIKEKLTTHNSQIEDLTAAKLKAEETVNDLKSGFEQREETLSKMNSDLKARGQELEEQNKTLLEQFTQLSDKMSSIQAKLSSSGNEGANLSFSEDEARSSDQLREIIKYLRKEREVAVGKLEVSQSESTRLEAQKKSLESQVDLLNKYLAEEKEKNKASVESAGKYGELMRKVHTMDALADSNRLLREEKESLKTSLDETRVKLCALETQIGPLQEKLRETEMKLDTMMADKKSLENERESLKKRNQELVEKLNKSRPEDVIKLQQEVNNLQKSLQSKESEINLLKNRLNFIQKNHQTVVSTKNQLNQQLQNAREEARKLTEENKKLSLEKTKLHQQNMVSLEKIQSLETSAHLSQTSQQQEQVKNREQRNQILQQVVEARQKEEAARRELESLKKTLEAKDSHSKELENKLLVAVSKTELLQKQCGQLRKIANKYKTKVESSAEPGESGVAQGEEEIAKENEERNILRAGDPTAKKEDTSKLLEQINKLKADMQKKDEELTKIKATSDGGTLAKLQSELELKNQELQKASASYSQFKERFNSQLSEINKKLDESQSKKSVYESRIMMLEKEKDQSVEQIEALNKKLALQQKVVESLQKQTASGQKIPSSVMSIEKPSTDSPPTANIKPMAAPIPTPAVSSPRTQGTSQGGSSRSIPTASIRPMAPTSTPAGQTSSSVVVVPPMESHSGGDGAVSSTVTLPQATVTPTPVAPASTTTQAFPPTLTATVSPTPVSQSSIASTAPFAQPHVASVAPRQEESMEASITPTPSGSADALISQAIALVSPQVDDRSSGQKRKLEVVQEEDEEEDDELEDAKRSRLQQDEARIAEEEEEEEETMQQREEDMGEPSSSSSHQGERKKRGDEEIMILSSDEECNEVAPPPSQSGRGGDDDDDEGGDDGDAVADNNEGGREAEAEGGGSEGGGGGGGGEVPSTAPSSSLQPPPRPLHEPPSSSSRQSLALFHHQLPNYEESVDDRIVPSTPTLYVSRPCEGAAGDGVSSPQVPSQGFEFGSSSNVEGGADTAAPSNEGLSQIAEGGIIDVTRMDLAQLDDGSHRSVPSTPVRRSPAVEMNTEGNISSSGGDGETGAEETRRSPSDPNSEGNAEPDSVIQMTYRTESDREQEQEGDLSAEGRDGRADYVVSSQELEEAEEEEEEEEDDEAKDEGDEQRQEEVETLQSVEVIDDDDDEDDEEEPHEEEEEEENDDEEEEQAEEDVDNDEDDEDEDEEGGASVSAAAATKPPSRSTRSSTGTTQQPSQKKITPIVWGEGSSRPSHSSQRGTRGVVGGRGGPYPRLQTPRGNPRSPGPRGSPRPSAPRSAARARRSRPGYQRGSSF